MIKSDCFTCGTICIALFTRTVFCLHCVVGIFTVILQVGWFHYKIALFVGVLALCVETILTVYRRKGIEYFHW